MTVCKLCGERQLTDLDRKAHGLRCVGAVRSLEPWERQALTPEGGIDQRDEFDRHHIAPAGSDDDGSPSFLNPEEGS